MSRIIKMVDEIKEYYNLNDTLLASDLGIMQQTIKGWREGRKPKLPTYNKVKELYGAMKLEKEDKAEKEDIESQEDKNPYGFELPEDGTVFYYINMNEAAVETVTFDRKHTDVKSFMNVYSLSFLYETKIEAIEKIREYKLLFRIKKWVEEHNGGWTPDWEDFHEIKYFIICRKEEREFDINRSRRFRPFSKLPYFKSEKIAEQFIKEFGDEIIEVLF